MPDVCTWNFLDIIQSWSQLLQGEGQHPCGRTLETPDMMMVLFFRGDFSFSFEDSLSCRMATSATGSTPFSTSSSAGQGRGH